MSAERDLPHVALSSQPHDRRGQLRSDAEWLRQAWESSQARVLTVYGNQVPTGPQGPVWVAPDQAPAGERIYLGERAQAPHFAVLAAADDLPGDAHEWRTPRAVLGLLTPQDAPLVLEAIGLAEWHRGTRYCPRCGTALEARAAGHELHCAGCGRTQFPRTDPAVIMLIAHGEPGSADERCLLGRSPAWPEGRYSTLAGFVEPGETLEDAVRREVAEETGVAVGEVRYLGSQPWPLPSSLMIGFTGTALSTRIEVDAREIADAGWFTREELRAGAASGELLLPSGVSISASLIQTWLGGPLSRGW